LKPYEKSYDVNHSFQSAGYAGQTYYGAPPLKHSHYGWKTAAGFFLQGIGSSARIMATLGDLLDREENRDLTRAGRAMAFLASPVGPMLFLAALHTPSRWYNMLRIFRPTSPMSIGIWTLTKMGIFNTLSAAGALLEHLGFERLGRGVDRVFGAFSAAAGGLVSFYMGSEIEETSTPVWIGAFPFLPGLLAATGFSNGTAALSLTTSLNGGRGGSRLRLQRIGALSSLFQIVLAGLMSGKLHDSLGPSATHRRTMALVWPAVVVPAILRFAGMRFPRSSASRMEDFATLLGGAVVIGSLVLSGRRSGNIAQEYFKLTGTTQKTFEAAGRNRAIEAPRTAPGQKVNGIAGRTALGGGIALIAGMAAYFLIKGRRSSWRR